MDYMSAIGMYKKFGIGAEEEFGDAVLGNACIHPQLDSVSDERVLPICHTEGERRNSPIQTSTERQAAMAELIHRRRESRGEWNGPVTNVSADRWRPAEDEMKPRAKSGYERKPSMDEVRSREVKSAKYYTAVTRRPPKINMVFQALTSSCVPLPHLFDTAPCAERDFNRNSIQSWQDEIQKPPFPRPNFAVPARCETPRRDYDFSENYNQFRTSVFHSSKRTVPSRHYIISPEWFSEKSKRTRKNIRNAALRFGWC